MRPDIQLRRFDRRDLLLYSGFATAKVLVHLLSGLQGRYGYFRDELYYLDCAGHLDWGYVDQPPLSIIILFLTRLLFGDSMFAIRLPAVLIGAATVVVSGLIAREMGGGRFAQALTCLAALAAPIFLALGSFFSMNSFDLFFWAMCALLVARIIRTENPRLWLWFGLVAGLGLANKLSMAFFGVGLAAGMLATPLRGEYRKWQFWAGGLIAAALFAPYALWQFSHDFATLEFMRNAALYKNMPTTIVDFLLGQVLLIGPLSAPLWVAGLAFGVFSKRGRPFMIFSLIYLVAFTLLKLSNGKVYYLSPAYPMLLAMGAIRLETAARKKWIKTCAVFFVALGGAAMAPYALPLLPVESFLRYQDAMGIRAPQQERAHSGKLPQHFGDRFGWEEFADMVAAAYNALAPADREKCSIFVSNYAEAGAVDLFGQAHGLPRAISGHMSHYFWGPGAATGEVMLVYGFKTEDLENLFESVVEVARFSHPYVMDRQSDKPLYLCRNLKLPVAEAWKQVEAFY